MEQKTTQEDRETVARFFAHAATVEKDEDFDQELAAQYLAAANRQYQNAPVDLDALPAYEPSAMTFEDGLLRGLVVGTLGFVVYLAFTSWCASS